MAAILDGGRLRLTGYVGDHYFEDGFTSAEVVMALAGLDEDADLDVHINSYGGIATEGAAIHALLTARPGTTNVVVEGIAASAASLIAMAGERVTMSAGAVMMIHDPATFAFGPAADLLKAVDQLEALGTSYARVYAAKSGKSPEACRDIMKAETWFTAEQAVEAGFADATSDTPAVPVAAFDYRAFAHAPQRLVALAKRKKWSTEASSPRQIKEPSMTDKPTGGVDTAELDRLRAELAATTAKLTEATTKLTDRERADAIKALPEASGREKLADVLASQGLTVEQAKAALAAAAPAEADDDEDGEADTPDPVAYERRRMPGMGLSAPAPRPKAKIDRAAIFAMRAKRQEG